MDETTGKKRKKDKEKEDEPFESALEKLENTVESLEKGNLSLEDSIKNFREGIRLYNLCVKKLHSAEGEIQKVLQEADGTLTQTPLFPPEEE